VGSRVGGVGLEEVRSGAGEEVFGREVCELGEDFVDEAVVG
jgi:hypothetical protein